MASLTPCSLISLEGADQGNQEASQRELRATQSTVECIEACRIDEIFADSKFLKAESLHELVKAIMWVSGPVMRIAATGEDSDVAEVSCGQQGHPNSACCEASHQARMLQSVFRPFLVSTFSFQLPAGSLRVCSVISAMAASVLHKAIQAAL